MITLFASGVNIRIVAVLVDADGVHPHELPVMCCYHQTGEGSAGRFGFMIFDAKKQAPARLEESSWAAAGAKFIVAPVTNADRWWSEQITEAGRQLRACRKA